MAPQSTIHPIIYPSAVAEENAARKFAKLRSFLLTRPSAFASRLVIMCSTCARTPRDTHDRWQGYNGVQCACGEGLACGIGLPGLDST